MKVKISKFTVAVSLVLVILIATIYAYSLAWIDFCKWRTMLNNCYWCVEHSPRTCLLGSLIGYVEAKLRQKQAVLALLRLLIVTSVVVLLVACLYGLKRRLTDEV